MDVYAVKVLLVVLNYLSQNGNEHIFLKYNLSPECSYGFLYSLYVNETILSKKNKMTKCQTLYKTFNTCVLPRVYGSKLRIILPKISYGVDGKTLKKLISEIGFNRVSDKYIRVLISKINKYNMDFDLNGSKHLSAIDLSDISFCLRGDCKSDIVIADSVEKFRESAWILFLKNGFQIPGESEKTIEAKKSKRIITKDILCIEFDSKLINSYDVVSIDFRNCRNNSINQMSTYLKSYIKSLESDSLCIEKLRTSKNRIAKSLFLACSLMNESGTLHISCSFQFLIGNRSNDMRNYLLRVKKIDDIYIDKENDYVELDVSNHTNSDVIDPITLCIYKSKKFESHLIPYDDMCKNFSDIINDKISLIEE